MKPGVYRGLSFEEYLAIPAISRSSLLHIQKSPARFLWHETNPPKQTDAMRLGNAIHCAVLEPERFERAYAIGPDIDLRSKANKELWAAFCAENPGAETLRAGEGAMVRAIAAAVRANSYVKPLLAGGGDTEVVAVWEDEETGVLCKARLDRTYRDRASRRIVLDLKSASDASEDAFVREVANRQLHIQGAFYPDGWARATGEESERLFVFVVYEKDPPYAAAVYPLDSESVATGRTEYRRMLRLLKWCREAHRWPDGTRQARTIGLPGYYRPYSEESRYMEAER